MSPPPNNSIATVQFILQAQHTDSPQNTSVECIKSMEVLYAHFCQCVVAVRWTGWLTLRLPFAITKNNPPPPPPNDHHLFSCRKSLLRSPKPAGRMPDVQNYFHKALAVIFAKAQYLYFRRKLLASSIEWYFFQLRMHSMYAEVTLILMFSHTNFHWTETRSACTALIRKTLISAWRPFNGTNCGITFQ